MQPDRNAAAVVLDGKAAVAMERDIDVARIPAERLVRAAVAGELGAITFTSQPAVRFLFTIADRLGLRDDLVRAANDGTVLPVCIGPVCAEAGEEIGLTTMVWPEPFRLPPMVRLVAERLGVPASEVPDPLP